MLINASNISFRYSNEFLFDNSSFVINETDKIGLIGNNGVGKSTLLKIILKELEPTSGSITFKKDLKIGYLPQKDSFSPENTIFTEAKKALPTFDEFKIQKALSKMGLDDSKKLIKELSGGERKRLGLALMMNQENDILILDEPTNHLDIWMINNLEAQLKKYNKAILLVTHDRYFLERITGKIMDIDYKKISMYEGPYSNYLNLKAEYVEGLYAQKRKLTQILKKEAVWAALNPQARTTKAKGRLENFKKLEEEYAQKKHLLAQKDTLEISSIATRIGRNTIEMINLSCGIDKPLVENFNYNLKRFDRLGIIGKNGCGKTTLFKTILGLIPALAGEIKIGETVKIGYLEQTSKLIDSRKKIIDYILDYGEFIETTQGKLSASQLLDEYMFPPALQQTEVRNLSGGELRRLELVKVLITNPNVLFFDEPTNDLDIYTLEVLEDFLERFKGAVVVISHDRYFLDKVCDNLFIFDNNQLNYYTGIVSDYEFHEDKKEAKKATVESDVPRFTSAEKKEFDHILEDIDALEQKVKKLKDEQATITTDYTRLMEISKELEELDEKILEKMERWEYLNEINERIEEYRKNKYK